MGEDFIAAGEPRDDFLDGVEVEERLAGDSQEGRGSQFGFQVSQGEGANRMKRAFAGFYEELVIFEERGTSWWGERTR